MEKAWDAIYVVVNGNTKESDTEKNSKKDNHEQKLEESFEEKIREAERKRRTYKRRRDELIDDNNRHIPPPDEGGAGIPFPDDDNQISDNDPPNRMGNSVPVQNAPFRTDNRTEPTPPTNASSQVGGIGGVMLCNTATIVDFSNKDLELVCGNFSLVIDGKNARIDPRTYRKFITALWCVYYCDQDPGISIDPIAPDVDKHLVRYIGRVINTDLGRVMREADYLMKKWAVGAERPD
jgi:hypothetical protein